MNLIPSLVVWRGGAYHTVNHKIRQYLGDPVNIMKILSDYQVNEIAVVVKDSESVQIIQSAVQFIQRPISITGLNLDIDLFNGLIRSGVDRIGLNCSKIDIADLKNLCSEFGQSTLIANIDVNKMSDLNLEFKEYLLAISDFVGETILHDIATSGTQSGLNSKLIEFINLLTSVSNIRISVEGGFNGHTFDLNEYSAVYYSTNYIYKRSQGKRCDIIINPS